MFDRGQAPVVSLFMDSVLYPPSPSRNLLIDLPGSERPLEYVMIGGHADSWDIAGERAHTQPSACPHVHRPCSFSHHNCPSAL